MINILRLRPKDVEWGNKKDEESYYKEFLMRYGGYRTLEDCESLSAIQLLDYARLRIAFCLCSDKYKNDYMNICLDEERQSFVVSFDGLDKEVGKFLGDSEDEPCYLPFQRLFLNQRINDPFVHFDDKYSLFSLPANVFIHNKELLKELDLLGKGFETIEHSMEIEDLLHYDEDRSIWVYSLTGVIFDEEQNKFKEGWNYVASQSVEDNSENIIVAYDEEGKDRGKVDVVSTFNIEDLLVVKKGGIGLDNIVSGVDYNFNQTKNVAQEIMFIYVSQPTDGFLLVLGGLNGKDSVYVPISVQFSDYDNITDKYVFDEASECLYVPIRVMSLENIHKLHTLGFSWANEDIKSIGFSDEHITPEMQRRIVEETIDDMTKHGVRTAVKNMLDKLMALGHLDASGLDYDAMIEHCMDYVCKLVQDKREEYERMGYDFSDIKEEIDNLRFNVDEPLLDDTEDGQDEDVIVF